MPASGGFLSFGDAYEVERELGPGGMARVFVARDTTTGRRVAIKLVGRDLSSDVSVRRFVREIRLTAALRHPNVVTLIASGTIGGEPYYVMPFVEGPTLRRRLDDGRPIAIDEVRAILADVCRALEHAHGKGIVHRDVKPENVFLTDGGAVVVDFGVGKAIIDARIPTAERPVEISGPVTTTMTRIGLSVGTPPYMSPEQITAEPTVDHRADLYSLGCMAFEMLAGRPPFISSNVHVVLGAHLAAPPVNVRSLRSDCPVELAELVAHCLAKDPAGRPQSAREVLERLEGRAVAPVRDEARSWRRALSAGVFAAAVVAALAAVASRNARSADVVAAESAALVSARFDSAFARRDAASAERWCADGARLAPRGSAAVRCRLLLMTLPERAADASGAARLVASLASMSPAPAHAQRSEAMGLLAVVLARAGQGDSASRVLDALRDGPARDVSRAFLYEEAYVRLLRGDRNGALASLTSYLDANAPLRARWRTALPWWFEPLRDEPILKDALAR